MKHEIISPVRFCLAQNLTMSCQWFSSFAFPLNCSSRWRSWWMGSSPPLVTPRKITPCWAPMTSSTSVGAPTRQTCPDHQSATTSWAVWKMSFVHIIMSIWKQGIFCCPLSYLSCGKDVSSILHLIILCSLLELSLVIMPDHLKAYFYWRASSHRWI